jgi:hypothetical protein
MGEKKDINTQHDVAMQANEDTLQAAYDMAGKSIKMFEQNLRHCLSRNRSDIADLIAEEARRFSIQDPRDDEMMADTYPNG